MTAIKTNRPAFQSVELEPMDLRLEAKAIEKGIPTLVNPVPEAATHGMTGDVSRGASISMPVGSARDTAESTPRARMKTLNVEVPDYAWVAIKMRAAQEMSSVRHVIMTALRAQGIEIRDADMIEDGRRLRGDSN